MCEQYRRLMRLTTLRIFGDELFNTPGDRILGIPKSSKRNSRRPPLGLLPALRSFKRPIPFEIAGLATLTSHFVTKVRLICGTSPKQPYIKTCYQQVTLALEIASAYGRRETTGASISANAKLQPRFLPHCHPTIQLSRTPLASPSLFS
jgi:hypothetical protein